MALRLGRWDMGQVMNHNYFLGVEGSVKLGVYRNTGCENVASNGLEVGQDITLEGQVMV